MTNWLLILLHIIVYAVAWHHFGALDAVGVVAVVYIFSPHKLEW